MSCELVTGHLGEKHINPEDDAGLTAGILGADEYVLVTGDQLAINVVSANSVTIGTGDLVMQGYHVTCQKPTTLTITNGAQGMKRNDLIACRYTKTTAGIQSADLVVIKGTATTGTPVDPTYTTGDIRGNVSTHTMPLYRIPLDGITVGTPVPLFNVLKPMQSVWDSLTQSGDLSLGGGWVTSGVARWKRVGDMLILAGIIKSNYAVNPSAGDVLFRLPTPAKSRFRAIVGTNMWWQSIVMEAAAGSNTVKLVGGETGTYNAGTEIVLSGLSVYIG
ncbi:hypothetical protein [Bifidobacterium platyrrhinorum]|uniref:Uncharacterized protein n=1 Tax=Bifidobacterium platyrrhinorum TaxID=2661628 RepID=A0A6L9SU30_9BIFI|nr:hypothetical protein [Bifidobacterium platyrrhinorum]NEG56126.1 hypothetical protein [Bifidobacterium platyrrhinorum]